MIVRDEEDHLLACHESFLALDAEWIIVDTGSVDETITIAKSFADHVEAVSWCDDFSAVRNAAIAKCTGSWIFIIDADERMTADGVRWLADATALPADRAYRFLTKNFTGSMVRSGFTPDASFAGYSGWYPSRKVRLFPNASLIRFRGVVHEMVEPSLVEGQIPILDSPFAVHHFPESKSPDSLKRKQHMYLRLGKHKLEVAPDDAAAHFEYGNQCAEMGAYAEAVAAFRAALKIDGGMAAGWKDLGAVLHLMGLQDEAEQSLRIAIRMDRALDEAWRNLGVVLAAKGQFDEALDAIAMAAQLNPQWSEAKRYQATIEKQRDEVIRGG